MPRYPFVSSSLKSEQGALERTLRVSECGAQRWGGGGQRLQLRRRRAPHTRGGDSVALSTAGSACPAAFRGELAQRGGQRRPPCALGTVLRCVSATTGSVTCLLYYFS